MRFYLSKNPVQLIRRPFGQNLVVTIPGTDNSGDTILIPALLLIVARTISRNGPRHRKTFVADGCRIV